MTEPETPKMVDIEIDSPDGFGATTKVRINGKLVQASSLKIEIDANRYNIVQVTLPARLRLRGKIAEGRQRRLERHGGSSDG